MRIDVDTSRCQGHALCVLNTAELFDLDEAGSRAVVLMDEVPAALLDQARMAVDGCPEGALAVTE